jgi:hypothetical protein
VGSSEKTTRIPSFAKYRSKSGDESGPKVFQYFMVGTMGALSALGAKATVQGGFHSLWGSSSDASVEYEVNCAD